MIQAAYQELRQLGGDSVKLDEPLSRYTVARLGGPADVLITAHDGPQLAAFARECWARDVPTRVIGGGANVLFSDAGFRGAILINKAAGLTIDAETGRVMAESGVGLAHLARETITHGLTGFEWAIGVPGTVGGAVVNNAGAHGRDMAANLVSAEVLFADEPQPQTLSTLALAYRYRESSLKHRSGRYAVLSAHLQFVRGQDRAELRARADEYSAHRKRTQPPGSSLGSMFKNPPGDYAGRLIEAAGLKGAQSGGVIISPIHANFFVNTGGGSASDYLALIRLAQQTVRDHFGIELELEIEVIA